MTGAADLLATVVIVLLLGSAAVSIVGWICIVVLGPPLIQLGKLLGWIEDSLNRRADDLCRGKRFPVLWKIGFVLTLSVLGVISVGLLGLMLYLVAV